MGREGNGWRGRATKGGGERERERVRDTEGKREVGEKWRKRASKTEERERQGGNKQG